VKARYHGFSDSPPTYTDPHAHSHHDKVITV